MIRKLTVMLLSGVMCLMGVTSALAITYNQSPMLDARVAIGELPSVEERLPEEPMVVEPGVLVPKGDLLWEIGQYRGPLRLVQTTLHYSPDLFYLYNEPTLSSPGVRWESGEGVLKGFEVSTDGKVFTFHMRKGLKWSDGVPVTTADVLFAYEDVLLNKKITPLFPQWLKSASKADGEPLKLEVIDDYTFRIRFAESYEGFPSRLANMSRAYIDFIKPKHYLKNFHVRYTPLEKLEPLIREESLTKGEWWTLFAMKDVNNWDAGGPKAIGFPVLYPWIVVKATPTMVTLERNPYYWKVDMEGNQLPYIDTLKSQIVSSSEMSTMKVLAGEVDFFGQQGSLFDLALYMENHEAGGYRVVLLKHHNAPTIATLNFNYRDPAWRKVVGDARFRKALNMAINREEIIDAVYFGFAELPTTVPSIYDPVKADQLLDEMGLDQRDAEGWRLGPDGKRFVISFEVAPGHFPDLVPVVELLIEYWESIGIRTTLKTIAPALWCERWNVSKIKACVYSGAVRPWWALPNFSYSAPLWRVWNETYGKEGVEPPELVKKMGDWNDLMAASPQERKEIRKKFRDAFYENVFQFITVEGVSFPVIVSKKLGNVPFAGYAVTATLAGEQLFLRK